MSPPVFSVDGPPGAPVVVLCNSLGTTSSLWDSQMTAMIQRFRVVRWELPGHGGSPVKADVDLPAVGSDLLGILNDLQTTRASLCGVSLGGMVAAWVASHHPERVDRLVLACTAAHLPPAAGWLERAALVRQSGTPGALALTLLPRWFTPLFLEHNPEVAERVAAELGAVDPEGYALCCEMIAGIDLRGALKRIEAPTLIIAGAEDPVVTPAMALSLHQGVTGSALTVLASAGHLANVEQSDVFTDLVVHHLKGLDAARGRAIRSEVLGPEHVAQTAAEAGSFSRPFYELSTRYAWGDIWSRPGLERERRSCITIAMLVALGRFDELPMHLRAARRVGLTDDEICEVLLQTAVYCGLPAANSAFRVAEEILGEEPSA